MMRDSGEAASMSARRVAFVGTRYATLSASFVGVLLISNVVAIKPIAFGAIPVAAWFAAVGIALPVAPEFALPLVFDGGVFLFPLAYVLGGVLTEVYGVRAARRAIITALVLAITASLTILAVQLSPPAVGWQHQQAFVAVLGFVPRIVLASLSAFLLGQLVHVWVLARMRRQWGGRLLRTRLLISTVVGEAADTLLFCTVAFWGIMTGVTFIMYVLLGYLVKVLVEALLLPVTTRMIRAIRLREQHDQREDAAA